MSPPSPFARALLAFHAGRHDATFSIARDDGHGHVVPVGVFFDDTAFDALETAALQACRGRVLDVGAGAGRHALALLRRGLTVTALDVEPACATILRARGVADVVTGDALTWRGARFDTVLMLMNGLGLVCDPRGLDAFLAHVPHVLAPGGQVLCDSIDVTVTTNPVHVAYREANVAAGRAPGQQRLRITLDGETGPEFAWLHVAPGDLAAQCAAAGLSCEVLHREADGRYLARISVAIG